MLSNVKKDSFQSRYVNLGVDTLGKVSGQVGREGRVCGGGLKKLQSGNHQKQYITLLGVCKHTVIASVMCLRYSREMATQDTRYPAKATTAIESTGGEVKSRHSARY